MGIALFRCRRQHRRDCWWVNRVIGLAKGRFPKRLFLSLSVLSPMQHLAIPKAIKTVTKINGQRIKKERRGPIKTKKAFDVGLYSSFCSGYTILHNVVVIQDSPGHTKRRKICIWFAWSIVQSCRVLCARKSIKVIPFFLSNSLFLAIGKRNLHPPRPLFSWKKSRSQLGGKGWSGVVHDATFTWTKGVAHLAEEITPQRRGFPIVMLVDGYRVVRNFGRLYSSPLFRPLSAIDFL